VGIFIGLRKSQDLAPGKNEDEVVEEGGKSLRV
jgi:hypothetical protein